MGFKWGFKVFWEKIMPVMVLLALGALIGLHLRQQSDIDSLKGQNSILQAQNVGLQEQSSNFRAQLYEPPLPILAATYAALAGVDQTIEQRVSDIEMFNTLPVWEVGKGNSRINGYTIPLEKVRLAEQYATKGNSVEAIHWALDAISFMGLTACKPTTYEAFGHLFSDRLVSLIQEDAAPLYEIRNNHERRVTEIVYNPPNPPGC